jgi:hypothetical protein
MPWLKRNLILIVGIVVALVLMGLAGWYSFNAMGKNQAIEEQLTALTDEFQNLVNPKGKPDPGDEKVNNIAIAKEQHERLKETLKRTRNHFVPLPYPTNVNAGEFKLLLENTIQDLTRTATNAGVKLPPKFNFTFNAQRTIMNPDKPDLLAPMVMDIAVMCDILFKARIHELLGMRRAAVSIDDTQSSGEFLPNKLATNDLAVVVPYEATFRGFSAELAAVVHGFYSAPQCFVIKNITVEKGEIPVTGQETSPLMPGPYPGMNPYMMQYMMRGMGRGEMMRGSPYGMRGMMGPYGSPYGMMPPALAPTPAPAAAPQKPGLDENPLKITLFVQLYRLKPPEAKGAARPARRAPAMPVPEGAPAEAPATDPAAAPPASN